MFSSFVVACAFIYTPFLLFENQFRYFKRERHDNERAHKKNSEAIAHSSHLPFPLHQKDTFNIWTFNVTLG